ncbi:MAG: hypothetical protein B5766_08860 [Candidatus Lumbricidophila eiseniae]|uniref:ABC transporter domain-containing protein n=1 Tax=Candidatus Lumbricidiphila eiseniae TaxID=1969409 RepID=A0A2A6FPQ3_9MICO|nr:MAG: hypothetical protein B5766_08860 [Candidatus Lumbricidophila eiseniae]
MTDAIHDLPLATAPGPLTGSGLGKKIGTKSLWSGLNATFLPGTITALVGPSGAGKTTLLNCLGLLEPLTEGTLTYNGTSISAHGRQRRSLFRHSFGFMFQNFGLIEQWDVSDNLTIPLRAGRVPRHERARRITSALAVVGLTGRDRDPVHVLSGGEQQRVAFARLLLHQPEVVFVDEPTASLDEFNADTIIDLLRTLTTAGAIIIVSTHDTHVRDRADATIDLSTGR